MVVQDLHFYNPVDGINLPRDPFTAIVGPRPIGWISCRSKASSQTTIRNSSADWRFAGCEGFNEIGAAHPMAINARYLTFEAFGPELRRGLM
jgi:hypothetical protein